MELRGASGCGRHPPAVTGTLATIDWEMRCRLDRAVAGTCAKRARMSSPRVETQRSVPRQEPASPACVEFDTLTHTEPIIGNAGTHG